MDHLGGGKWESGSERRTARAWRGHRRMASARDITEPGAYHLVYRRAMLFVVIQRCRPRKAAATLARRGAFLPRTYAEIVQRTSAVRFRMTGFGLGARGHAKHLLKTRGGK